MNAGEFDKRITILKHTRDADGNYSLVPQYKRWAKIQETAETCVYSNYAFGVKALQVDTRLLSLPCGTFILCPPNTCLVTACITDRMYSHITAAGVIVSQCTASRYTAEKDELNRPRRELRRLFSFPAVVGEKYVRPIEYITHGEVERGVVLTTHIEKIEKATKAFGSDITGLQQRLDKLNKTRVSLQVNVTEAVSVK